MFLIPEEAGTRKSFMLKQECTVCVFVYFGDYSCTTFRETGFTEKESQNSFLL